MKSSSFLHEGLIKKIQNFHKFSLLARYGLWKWTKYCKTSFSNRIENREKPPLSELIGQTSVLVIFKTSRLWSGLEF